MNLSVSRILIEASFIFKGTFFRAFVRLLVTAKRYLLCSFDRNVSKPQKRYLFRAFEEIASNQTKVPFSRCKVLFSKVHEKWMKSGHCIDAKIFFTRKLKMPAFFS